MKGIPEDASLLAKTLYRYGTSKSPVKRGIASGVIGLIEATGSKERTAKKNAEATKNEKEALTKFLNSKVTQNALEKLGVNSRVFNLAVFRAYPFNTRKYNIFIRAFVVLRNELRENMTKNRKLNPSKYHEIIVNMLKYEDGDTITRHVDYMPMTIDKDEDSDEYSNSEVMGAEEFSQDELDRELEDLARKSDSLADTSSLFKKGILKSVEDRGTGISDYKAYLEFMDDDDIEDKETLRSRRNSVMRSIEGEMNRLQVGGFCYNATNKLKEILRGKKN
jgi:hypothetical protein